jgi:hypothetical protein
LSTLALGRNETLDVIAGKINAAVPDISLEVVDTGGGNQRFSFQSGTREKVFPYRFRGRSGGFRRSVALDPWIPNPSC